MTALVNAFQQSQRLKGGSLSLSRVDGLQRRDFKRYDLLPVMPHRAWLIEEGFVRRVNYSESGHVITHGLWSKQDIVGLPNAGDHHYELECLTSVRCRLVRLQDVNMAKIRLQQLRQMEMFINILHCHRMAQRIWILLDWMGAKYAQVCAHGRLLELPLTHEALAELIGTSRVTVTRILKELEEKGKLVKLSQRRILLHQTSQVSSL